MGYDKRKIKERRIKFYMEIKNLRNEIKRAVSSADADILRQLFGSAEQGWISTPAKRMYSLRFERKDNLGLDKKRSANRESFTLFYINDDMSNVSLVKKSKRKDSFLERSSVLSKGECERILAGDFACLSGAADPLVFEFYNHLRMGDLHPRILVDFKREVFSSKKAGVQISLESDFYTGFNTSDFFNERHPTIKRTGPVVMEVKYDKVLPEILSRLTGGEKKAKAGSLAWAYPAV